MEKFKKIIDSSSELIEKAKPTAEKIVSKTIETFNDLKKFSKDIIEKLNKKTNELIESGKDLYNTTIKSIEADAELVNQTEKETNTSEKLKDIWKRAKEITKNTKEKMIKVINNEVGAVGDITDKIDQAQSDSETVEIKDTAKDFRERIDQINREAQDKFDALTDNEKTKVKPIDLPWIEKKKRFESQLQTELRKALNNEWDSSKSMFADSSKGWENFGIAPEDVIKGMHEIRQATINGYSRKLSKKTNEKLDTPILNQIREERAQKKESEKQKANEEFIGEKKQAREGNWKDLNSYFYFNRAGNPDNSDRYESLKKINDEAVEKRKRGEIDINFSEEEKLAKEGKWDSMKSSFKSYSYNDTDKEKAEELNKINLNAIKTEGRKAFTREEDEAKKGTWNRSKSFFFKKSMFETSKLDDGLRKEFREKLDKLNNVNNNSKAEKEDAKKKKQSKQDQYDKKSENTDNIEIETIKILKIDPNNLTKSILKSAYRKFAKKNHPDIVNSQNISNLEKKKKEELMKMVSSGYESLLKKIKK